VHPRLDAALALEQRHGLATARVRRVAQRGVGPPHGRAQAGQVRQAVPAVHERAAVLAAVGPLRGCLRVGGRRVEGRPRRAPVLGALPAGVPAPVHDAGVPALARARVPVVRVRRQRRLAELRAVWGLLRACPAAAQRRGGQQQEQQASSMLPVRCKTAHPARRQRPDWTQLDGAAGQCRGCGPLHGLR